MTWVKQSDRMWCDARFCNLSDGAQALWHRANSYLADQLLDGLIPTEALRHLKTRKRYVEELEQSGYWIPQESGGWLAASWQEFIQPRAIVLARRSEEKQRLKSKRCTSVDVVLVGPVPVPELTEELTTRTDTSVAANAQHFANDWKSRSSAATMSPAELLLAARGRTLLARASQGRLDYEADGKWTDALARLAKKPMAQWKLVAVSLRAAIAQGKTEYLTPQHLVDYWPRYSAPVADVSEIRSTYERTDDDARKQREIEAELEARALERYGSNSRPQFKMAAE